MKLLPSVIFAGLACGFQIPIALNVFLDSDRPHYSTLAEADLPIDLSSYQDQLVVRLEAWMGLHKFLRNNHYKIWAHNPSASTVDVQVSDTELGVLKKTLGISHPNFVIKDLAQAVYETYPEGLTRSNMENFKTESAEEVAAAAEDGIHVASEVFFKLYRPLLSIDAWLGLLEQTYPDIVTIEVIGQTFEGRDYKVVHVSVPDDDVSHSEKKTVVITGGVHAREWISVSTTLYSIYEMLNNYEENPDTRKQLAKLDFLFIPVLNPDGYEYSWTTDRLWRKNRQHVEGGDDSGCTGIDIDHSYDYHWTQSSDTVCGEEFSGYEPFEAYELKVWARYLNDTNENHNIYGYIDLHSYSQEILYPYAYSCSETPRDEENLIELAYGISKAVRLTSGKYYAVLPACVDRDSDLIPDLGAGSALDYMYHKKAYWAFQMKLRDSGSHGFLLPDKYIQPVGEEISAGLRYFCRFILSDEH